MSRHENFIRWSVLRQRMIRETERFIDEQLSRSDRQIVIPTIRVGEGEFPRGYGDVYWAQWLATS